LSGVEQKTPPRFGLIIKKGQLNIRPIKNRSVIGMFGFDRRIFTRQEPETGGGGSRETGEMKDNQTIERVTEDVLRELNLKNWRFEVKRVQSVPRGEVRQIYLLDTAGNDRAAVVNFQLAKGSIDQDIKQLKARIRNQLLILSK
jgi:hypothetical protein